MSRSRVFRRCPDDDLVQSARRYGTVNVAGELRRRSRAVDYGRLAVLVVRGHVVVEHVVHVHRVVPVAGGHRRVGRPSAAEPRRGRGRGPRHRVRHQPHARPQAHRRRRPTATAAAAATTAADVGASDAGRRRCRLGPAGRLPRAAQHGTAVGRRPVAVTGGRRATDAGAQPDGHHGRRRMADGRSQR